MWNPSYRVRPLPVPHKRMGSLVHQAAFLEVTNKFEGTQLIHRIILPPCKIMTSIKIALRFDIMFSHKSTSKGNKLIQFRTFQRGKKPKKLQLFLYSRDLTTQTETTVSTSFLESSPAKISSHKETNKCELQRHWRFKHTIYKRDPI